MDTYDQSRSGGLTGWIAEGTTRRRWRLTPLYQQGHPHHVARPPGGIGFGPPGPDLLQVMLAADARNAGREGWLGLAMAGLVLVLVAQGWFIPLLAAAFVLSPVVGIGLEVWDNHFRDAAGT